MVLSGFEEDIQSRDEPAPPPKSSAWRGYRLQDQPDHALRPPTGGNLGLDFSHALPVFVEGRRRREHPICLCRTRILAHQMYGKDHTQGNTFGARSDYRAWKCSNTALNAAHTI